MSARRTMQYHPLLQKSCLEYQLLVFDRTF
jgi:hypothetical protein